MRTFQQTHPWLTFRADLTHAPWDLWLTLGEARSKCEHIAGVPLRPDVAKQLYEVYLSKGVHATTSIEGNTLSEQDVRKRVQGRLPLPPSSEYLGREVDNIVEACREITSDLFDRPDLELTANRILHFNALTLRGLDVEDGVVPGECRSYSVGVAGYRGAPAEDCPYLLDRLCEWLNGPDFRPVEGDKKFLFAFFKAVLAHLYIAWIHPFGDGNGRTARLVEFQILAQSGLVPLPATHLLSNHYNATRSRYYAELDRASRSGGDVLPFLGYAADGFVEGLREQLRLVQGQQLDVTWINYVHEQFQGLDGAARSRQKHLLLSLPPWEWVERDSLTGLNPTVAKDYARKSGRTLQRDLEELRRMELLHADGRKYRAATEFVLAFLPPRLPEPAPPPIQQTGRMKREPSRKSGKPGGTKTFPY